MEAAQHSGRAPWGPAAATLFAGFLVAGAVGLAPSHGARLALLALLGVAALGAAYVVWHVDPAWTLTVSLCLSMFDSNWAHMGLAASPVPPDRILLVVGVAALVLHAPGASDRGPIRLRPIHWLLIVTLLYAIGSALAAGTLTTNSGFFRLFDRFGIAPFAMFVLAPVAFPDQRRRKILLGALIVTGAYLGLTALFETVGPRALVFPKFILNPDLGIHGDRARGPFLEAEANGIALYFCGAAAVIGTSVWRGRPGLKFAMVAVALLCALGCLFTLSRAVWVAALVATLVAWIGFGHASRGVLKPLAAGAIIIAATFFLIPGFSSKASERFSNQPSLWDRSNLNSAATNMIEAKPLFGFGWARFSSDSQPYFQQAPDIPLTAVGPGPCTGNTSNATGQWQPACTSVAHNSYLSNGAELGLIGLALWIASLSFAVGGAVLRRGPPESLPWRAGLLAVALMWCGVVFFTPLEGPFSPELLWLWAGLVGAWFSPHEDAQGPVRGADGNGRWVH